MVQFLWGRSIDAQERLLAYELAMQTGLRASEIHSLQRANLQLTSENPTVFVPSDITKDAGDANQSITKHLRLNCGLTLQTDP